MRLRWLLPPLAALSLGGALWIQSNDRSLSPEQLLESARAHLAAKPPDRVAASRELDEALSQARPEQAALRCALLEERSKLRAAKGLPELALADCQTRLEEFGPEADTLARASELALWLGEPGLALEFATRLVPLDTPRGQSRIGRARVTLADAPLAALESLARNALPPSLALQARTLAQRAAIYADDRGKSSAALDELLGLFRRADERRRATEWVREAADHLRAVRAAFVASFSPETTNEAVAGLQDLLLRAGGEREAADLGSVALALPKLADSMPVLARTVSAQVALGRTEQARSLVSALERRNPQALAPWSLPSLEARNELREWCLQLETLQLWQQLRNGAQELARRAGNDKLENQLALFLAAEADAGQKQFANAQRTLDLVGTNPVRELDLAVRVFLLRAQIARQRGQKPQERYALLLASKAAPLDPDPPLRAQIGEAWQRLSELQLADGDAFAAEVSMTHALRCSSERAAQLEPLWSEIGRNSLASRGVRSPYLLYTRAKNQIDRGQASNALADARLLLKDYPGLGPALEVAARAAEKLRDYPQAIESALELLERGWSPANPSALLRKVPKEYFLPQDQLRWMLLDPRGSLESVVRRLLAKGDIQGAAMAARGGPAKFQPPELLPLLARTEFDAGLATLALETLELLPASDELFGGVAGLALRAALASDRPEALATTLERVQSAGRALDPELCRGVDLLLTDPAQREDGQRLLAWLASQSPSFLGEVLLRQCVARLVLGTAQPLDEELERAASLLDDGRPGVGRLILALEFGDHEALAREARAVLETPFAHPPARRAALHCLAGNPQGAAIFWRDAPQDGRDFLMELAAHSAAAFGGAPEDPPLPGFSTFLRESFEPRRALVLGLAASSAPWCVWALVESAKAPAPGSQDPWWRRLRAGCWLTLELPERAAEELGPFQDDPVDPGLAWTRVLVARAGGADAHTLEDARLAWLTCRNRSLPPDPELAALEAARALRNGSREEARRILERALEARPSDPEWLRALAEVENTSGRRTRSIDVYGQLLALGSGSTDEPAVLDLIEVLGRARDEGEISATRWWAEVEALESARPLDPAPARALVEHSFEETALDEDADRSHALSRLERLRSRTLGRAFERLRPGEAQRWIRLLARHAPERAVDFAQEELRRDPSDPVVWRASAEALLAAGHAHEAILRLEALQRLAPELETARMLAVSKFQLENDRREAAELFARIQRIDPRAHEDPLLTFYGALVASGVRNQRDTLRGALELWKARDSNGLAQLDHGRALALALFQDGSRAQALEVLDDCNALAADALQRDVLEAMSYLMRAAPERERPVEPTEVEGAAGAPDATGPDDEPGKKPGGAGKGAKGKGGKGPKGAGTKAADGAGGQMPQAGKRGGKKTDGAKPGAAKPDAKPGAAKSGGKKAGGGKAGAKKQPAKDGGR